MSTVKGTQIGNLVLQRAVQRLIAEGRLIEAGWIGFRLMSVPTSAGLVQVNAMRDAFYAGAQQLFDSIMFALDPGKESTPADEKRMDDIAKELDRFKAEVAARTS